MNVPRRKLCKTTATGQDRHCPSLDNIENEKQLSEWVDRTYRLIDNTNCESGLKLDMKETLSELTSSMFEDIKLQEKLAQRLRPYVSRLLASSQKNLGASLIVLDRTKLRDLDDGGVIYGLTFLTQTAIHKQIVAISPDNTPIPIFNTSYQNLEGFCKEMNLRLAISMFLALITYFANKASRGESDNPYG